MKKSILVFSLMALGSLQLGAAPCVTGTLAAQAALGTCTITNGANTWTLGTWAFTQAPNYTNYPGFATPTTADINISFALDPSNFNGGFSVITTAVSDSYAGFTTSPNANGAQQGLLETSFRIAGNSGSALLTSFGGSLEGAQASFTVGVPNPAVTLQKYIQQLSSVGSGSVVQLILQPDTSSLPGSATILAPPFVFNNALIAPGVGDLVIVDRLRLDSGNTANTSASITGYSNYFAPTPLSSGIPEPMTFALMGAGLIGLAVLRRRK